ncbi:hypothetical protein [Solidesulfovibrio fructosivorans]|uniref:hypothetical protein n=1 Tax=Solidesulfovibrio fructosivorans TaxID=878 RepID=UPI0005C1C80A|nr:hypothetical protein [Solidesulfovibrio fructosivorans]
MDLKPLLDDDLSVDEFSFDMTLREFHGCTGGTGGIPESFEEVKKNTSPATMKKTMGDNIAKMSGGGLCGSSCRSGLTSRGDRRLLLYI